MAFAIENFGLATGCEQNFSVWSMRDMLLGLGKK